MFTLKKLGAAINETLQHDYKRKMLNRVLLSTAKYLDASKLEYAKDHRIRWTMYSNISYWFDNWEADLIELGFAFRDEHGKCIIPDQLLH